jgi:hypothetical protein
MSELVATPPLAPISISIGPSATALSAEQTVPATIPTAWIVESLVTATPFLQPEHFT